MMSDDLSAAAELPTRAARRARREALLREPVLSPLATVSRPLVAVSSLVIALGLGAAAVADPGILAAALAWIGLVLAWGWPRLHGSPSGAGSTIAIALTALGAPAAAALADEPPYLRYVPVTVAAGLIAMFLHQLLRRDGRPRLTHSIGVTAYGIATVAMGAPLIAVARAPHTVALVLAALAGASAGAVAGVGVGRESLRRWLGPLAVLCGGAVGIAVGGGYAGEVRLADAAIGAVSAAVTFAVHRVLLVLPAISRVSGQVSAAAAGLLSVGVVAVTLSRLL